MQSIDYLRGIRMGGRDAVAFAQAQFTAAVADEDMPAWAPACWCDPGGRALVFLLFRVKSSGVDLVLPAGQVESFVPRIKPYTIGRDVSFDGPHAVLAGGPASAPMAMHPDRGLAIAGADDRAAAGPDDAWLRADLCRALPWLETDTSGRFLPQMLGLEALGGLDYHKGCFPGQEVIARVHYRGRITRRTLGFRLARSPAPVAGAELDCDGGVRATVLYALADGDEAIGLAVFPADAEPGRTVEFEAAPGQVCEPVDFCE